jgi:hypothetical protein
MSDAPEPAGPEPVPERMTVAVAARHFGITERAVRKRIAAGRLRGVMIDRAWHVSLVEPAPEPEQGRGSAGSRNRNSSGPVPPAPVALPPPAAAIMQEWIAPLAARIEALARENGELVAELRNEREQRQAIARERDALLARVAHSEGKSSPNTANVAPEGAQRADEARSDDTRDAQRDATTNHAVGALEAAARRSGRPWWKFWG